MYCAVRYRVRSRDPGLMDSFVLRLNTEGGEGSWWTLPKVEKRDIQGGYCLSSCSSALSFKCMKTMDQVPLENQRCMKEGRAVAWLRPP